MVEYPGEDHSEWFVFNLQEGGSGSAFAMLVLKIVEISRSK